MERHRDGELGNTELEKEATFFHNWMESQFLEKYGN
jgi:hypothetical protein